MPPRGVILYAMVTGRLPFKEHQPRRVLSLMRRGPTFQPGLSPGERCHRVLPKSQSGLGVDGRRPGSAEPSRWLDGVVVSGELGSGMARPRLTSEKAVALLISESSSALALGKSPRLSLCDTRTHPHQPLQPAHIIGGDGRGLGGTGEGRPQPRALPRPQSART